MKVQKRGRQIARRLLASLLGIAACFAVTAQPAFAQDAAPQGGMTVHIDPRTGEILKAPAPGSVPLQLSPREQNALSTSHEGLVQVPSTVPGGGVKLDLQGRFQSPLIATVGEDGKVRMQHLGEPVEGAHQHQ
jgi:hypothetical protein